ncbi:DUF1080 domain-containing protein [Luteolibacter sp. AS25]|uniref:3-keto-disaccharide hydrolase n=1 Tax=Luteolibacter sp. AS25 TaxID=3135776 RepID=UPI00398B1D16
MKPIFLSVAFVSILGLGMLSAEEGFVPIFDGESLEGWKAARSDKAGEWGPFRINSEERAIHVYRGEEAESKQQNDCLYTEKEYSKFVLRMEYKWLEKRFAPRTDWDRDAGLLFHIHGKVDKVWPNSIEMQIGETPGDASLENMGRRFHSGDLFVLGKGLSCQTTKTGNIYDPAAELMDSRSCPTVLGKEKPKGEWNEMEITVDGANSATFKLNGEIVHKIENLETTIEGQKVPLAKGRIGVQAEWAELMYRNIRIKELD